MGPNFKVLEVYTVLSTIEPSYGNISKLTPQYYTQGPLLYSNAWVKDCGNWTALRFWSS